LFTEEWSSEYTWKHLFARSHHVTTEVTIAETGLVIVGSQHGETYTVQLLAYVKYCFYGKRRKFVGRMLCGQSFPCVAHSLRLIQQSAMNITVVESQA
jgi:hypothetical protein